MADSGSIITVPRLSLNEGELITLIVGPDEKKLVVHESCITRGSDFFKAAMKKEWIEGQTRIIKLPEETCLETWTHYLNFTYLGKLPTEEMNQTMQDSDEFDVLGKIHVLGERMLDKVVQNAVVREFVRVYELKDADGHCWLPGIRTVTMVYEGTSAGSQMRKLLVDMRISSGTCSHSLSTSHEFLVDFSQALFAKVIAQETVRDFRGRLLVAEHYFK
jgi:hypothetical protein